MRTALKVSRLVAFSKRNGAACFLVGPLLTALIVGWEMYSSDPHPRVFWGFFYMMLFFGYPVYWLIGIPTYFLLAAVRWTGFFTYVAIGTATSILLLVVGREPVSEGIGDMLQSPLQYWHHLQTPFLFGSIPTAAFWLIARPDQARAFFSR